MIHGSTEITHKQKVCVLALLVLQNATQTLLMRYSRGVLMERYHPGSVVLMTECCKLFVCSLIIYCDLGASAIFVSDKSIADCMLYLMKSSGYTYIPSTCYFVQNSLQYIASENLSSCVYSVLQQMKILSAAIACVVILNKKLSCNQWRALLLLCCGGLLMEYHTFEMHDGGLRHLANNNDPVKGTAAMVSIVGLSGFAGVMTQSLLKNKATESNHRDKQKLSIWDRNIQFAMWSVLFGMASLFIDTSWKAKGGLFADWSILTVVLVVVWTFGGLLVALTIKYTDVILKGFASAISLILICINGWFLLSDYLDIIFILGAFLTVIATFDYNESTLESAKKTDNI